MKEATIQELTALLQYVRQEKEFWDLSGIYNYDKVSHLDDAINQIKNQITEVSKRYDFDIDVKGL